MLKIRLKKIGRKKLAVYRIVVMENLSRRDGKALDYIGFYEPHRNILNLNKVKFAYWLNNGAQLSDRVRLLVKTLISKLEKK